MGRAHQGLLHFPRWLALALLLSVAGSGALHGESITQQREDAVRRARAGHMAEAQATLRSLLASGAEDRGLVAMDLVTLLQQDGKPREAADLFARTVTPEAPAYAL